MLTFTALGKYGQLGNQMFQYASLKGIAYNRGFEIKIPPLEEHNLSECFEFRDKEHEILTEDDKRNIWKNFQERMFCFDEEVFNKISKNTNFLGYFQTEKYFKHIAHIIRQDYTIQKPILDLAKKFIASHREKDKELVSLHVRRGDYVHLQSHHPLCTMDYYNIAMQHFEDVKFIVFSDDIAWCKKNFVGDQFDFSENASLYQDLARMTLCDHNILANSSFSWWGGWLNKNKNKIVIAPKRWLGSAETHNDTKDLIPKTWEVIDA